MMYRVCVAFVTAVLAVALTSCGGVKQPALQPTAPIAGASLWQQPTDLPSRDLFHGPWGAENAPAPDATYTFVELKHSGVNPGMTVVDPQGREWSVKQNAARRSRSGRTGRSRGVAAACLRLATTSHRRTILPSFWLKDAWGTHAEIGGRFRLKTPALKDIGIWSWQENPFIGTKPYQGLLVLHMMFNSTDLKNSNNTLYEHRKGDLVEQWFVSRDIGSALGDTHGFAPRKGNADAFERQPFILGVNNGHVDFAYKGCIANSWRIASRRTT